MPTRVLDGRAILVVEDEPLVALDIAEILGAAGAICLTANTLEDALNAAERSEITAAIVDRALKDGDTTKLCERLNKRSIPFMIYSGFNKTVRGACATAPHLKKPATDVQLVTAMVNLILRPAAAH